MRLGRRRRRPSPSPRLPNGGRVRGAAVLASAPLALAACGAGDDVRTADGRGGRPTLTLRAAASLTAVLTTCTEDYAPARVRLSFGGSDELAAQLRQGAGGDLYAAANATLPAQLAAEGRVRRPVVFARNELVLAVPARAGVVSGLGDLVADGGARLAVGAPSVPVGAYTRQALGRLPRPQRDAILDRVRTEEPEVGSVLAKLRQGVVDAAFVYRTDVRVAGGDVRAIPLPAAIRPRVSYAAAVVTRSAHPGAATALLRDLRSGGCARVLRAAGFLAPAAGG